MEFYDNFNNMQHHYRPPQLGIISFKNDLVQKTHQIDQNQHKRFSNIKTNKDDRKYKLDNNSTKQQSKKIDKSINPQKSINNNPHNRINTTKELPATRDQQKITNNEQYSLKKVYGSTQIIPELSESLQMSRYPSKKNSGSKKDIEKFQRILDQSIEQSIQLVSDFSGSSPKIEIRGKQSQSFGYISGHHETQKQIQPKFFQSLEQKFKKNQQNIRSKQSNSPIQIKNNSRQYIIKKEQDNIRISQTASNASKKSKNSNINNSYFKIDDLQSSQSISYQKGIPKNVKPKKQVQTELKHQQQQPASFLKLFLATQPNNHNKIAQNQHNPQQSSKNHKNTEQQIQDFLPLNSNISKKTRKKSTDKKQVKNIIETIFQMHDTKNQNQSPLKRRKSYVRKEKQKDQNLLKAADSTSKIQNKLESLITPLLFSNQKNVKGSQNSMFTQQQSKYDDQEKSDDSQTIDVVTKMLTQMMETRKKNADNLKMKVLNQKNLKLKDYMRLASLSHQKKNRFNSLSLRKQRIRQSKLPKVSQQASSPQRVAIDRSHSINLIKKAIETRFQTTMKQAKAQLYQLRFAGEKSLFQNQICIQNEENSENKLTKQTHIVEDSYQDLVFMCNIHRVFEDHVFVSVKALKQIMSDFRHHRRTKLMDEDFLNGIMKTLMSMKSKKKQGEKIDSTQRNNNSNILKSLTSMLHIQENENNKSIQNKTSNGDICQQI